MTSWWRTKARGAVAAALADGRARGLAGAALERCVREAYPFGLSDQHGKLVFAEEVRRAFERPKAMGVEPLPLFDREDL